MAQQGADERIEDAFHKDVIQRFSSTSSFNQFAVSKYGLGLSYQKVSEAKENNRFDVTAFKLCVLHEWKARKGRNATPDSIRATVENYFESMRNPDANFYPVEDDPQAEDIEIEVQHPNGANIQLVQRDPNDPTTINITNLQGPIQGPVLMGNETVMMGAQNGAGNPQIDPDVPALKPSKSEISTEKTLINIGDCKLKFPAHSLKESAKYDLSYKVVPTAPPDGHIYASSTLMCNPLYEGQKYAKIVLPTWCFTEASVDVGIFTRTGDEWSEQERPILTHEGHLELHYRFIDNLTAFVSRDRLPDITFKISCFLFNNADGKFAMGFCLSDKAIENVFLHRLKKEGYFPSIKALEPLAAIIEDKIAFKISPGQQMTNTHFIVDEQFVSSYQGHVSYCNIDKQAVNPVYKITQKRKQPEVEGESRTEQTVYEKSYHISGKEEPLVQGAAGHDGRRTVVEFRGELNTQNYLQNPGAVEIDNRNFAGDDAAPTWKKLTVDEKIKRAEQRQKKAEAWKGVKPEVRSGDTHVVFHGDINARNTISNATNVRIDNRRFPGNRPGGARGQEPVQNLVQPVQVNDGPQVEAQQQQHTEQPESEVSAVPTQKDCTQEGTSGEPDEEPPTDAASPPIPEHYVHPPLRERRPQRDEQLPDEGNLREDPMEPLPKRMKYDNLRKCVAFMMVLCMAFTFYSYML